MARVGPLDRALLAILVPIWAACFGLCLASLGRPALSPPLGVRAGTTGDYPTLVDVAPWVDSADAPLQRGDRLIQLGSFDLRDVGPFGFYARFAAQTHYGEPLPTIMYERAGRRSETAVPPPIWIWPPLPASLGFFATGLLLLFRARSSLLTRSLARASLLMAIATASPVTGGIALNYAGLAVGGLAWSLAFPSLLRAILLFAEGEREGASSRRWPWVFAVIGPLSVATLAGFPIGKPDAPPLVLATLLAFLVSVLVVVARSYRRADAVGRRQLRWLAFGFYGAAAPAATIVALLLLDGLLFDEWRRFQVLLAPSYSFGILAPLSLFFAIARYNVFDIDRLLSATASYNAALVAVVAAGLVVVPRIGELSSELLGVDPRTGQIAVSLALAAVVVPLHQRLRPRIDSVFFKERHALAEGVSELLRSMADCEDVRSLTSRVGEQLDRLLGPETCAWYARVEESYAPIFARGGTLPVAFSPASPLVATLGQHRAPLALGTAGRRRPSEAALGPFDRAALESLQAEVVVPVRIEGTLVGFLCFGPKRSGDVYTQTDVSHLAVVAEAISSQLRRFDQQAVLRDALAMQQSLRRYVPAAVAEQLTSGAELAAGERQVSVLFVDIRGYTGFAESRGAEVIFSTVNRYTEIVSEIVRKHGGSVVEFNGDGMMAVFGAPRPLADKECAAVAAAREIVPAVQEMPAGNGDERLSVGIGIATGAAFVGNIRAADRMIWSAIGNTTNLAARLQALTRELAAALVIDTATWQTLGPTQSDFRGHPAIAIRGRTQTEDVHAWEPGSGRGKARPNPPNAGVS